MSGALPLATPAQERELERFRATLSEREFQRQIVQLSKLYRWRVFHCLHAKGSEAGFPDLVLVRGERLLLVELKTETGRLRPAQREWLAALQQVADAAGGALDVGVWRPSGFEQIHRLLRSEP